MSKIRLKDKKGEMADVGPAALHIGPAPEP